MRAMAFDDPAAARPRATRRAANEQGLVALGNAIDRRTNVRSHRRHGRRSRRIWLRWTLVGVTAIVVLAILAVVGIGLYINSLANRTQINGEQTGGKSQYILLVGSTNRCALKVQN